MPCTREAVDVLRKANVLIAPAMAAGAGGVCSLLLHDINVYDFLVWVNWFLPRICFN